MLADLYQAQRLDGPNQLAEQALAAHLACGVERHFEHSLQIEPATRERAISLSCSCLVLSIAAAGTGLPYAIGPLPQRSRPGDRARRG